LLPAVCGAPQADVSPQREYYRGREDSPRAGPKGFGRPGSHTRFVRTFYGEDSEETRPSWFSPAEYDGTGFDDAALYDAVSIDGLHSLHNILTHIPQIVEGTPSFAAWYNEWKPKARDEDIEVGVDQFDYALPIFQLAAKWSHLLTYDKETKDGLEDVVLVYLDDRGRVLRYSRLDGAEELQAADGMLCSGQDSTQVEGRPLRQGLGSPRTS
jgi:hypothetical protein